MSEGGTELDVVVGTVVVVVVVVELVVVVVDEVVVDDDEEVLDVLVVDVDEEVLDVLVVVGASVVVGDTLAGVTGTKVDTVMADGRLTGREER